MLPEFQGFQKIPRLNRGIIITEKIDGTNAQIFIDEDGTVTPGSRKRWLTVDKDNHGFAAWAKEHEDELRELGPGRHFGEWWGRGIQRKYGLSHKRFSLFNVGRWEQTTIQYPTPWTPKSPPLLTCPPSCCHVVPILNRSDEFNTFQISMVLRHLQLVGSVAAPGFNKPEGIVVYHIASNNCFKVTLKNDGRPKGKKNVPAIKG